jgi:uncharacterized protein YegL
MRRLPVYILLDCSESMVGDAINSVQQGLDVLLNTLRTDPHALETAWVSIITFNTEAEQLVPLTELIELQTPKLTVRPGTCMGKALSLLQNCIEGEVRKTSSERRGDYRPLVFLLTDGQATDDWTTVKRAVDSMTEPKIANFYAIGCGDDVDYGILSEVSDAVFKVSDMTPETMSKLFIWLTASVRSASVGATTDEKYAGVDLSKKPAEVAHVPPGNYPRYDGLPLQVFLKSFCMTQKKPYLMRFRLSAGTETYDPLTAHKLDISREAASSFNVPTVQASQLNGMPRCPYCENPQILFCSCGALMCLPVYPPKTVECPSCLVSGELGAVEGDFDINTSAG